MSEPTERSTTIATSASGFVHWSVQDDRIRFRSDAYGIPTADGLLLIDPLPLAESVLRDLPPVAGILLTAGCHQRSAWRLRGLLEAPVMAPDGSKLDEAPDAWLDDGARPAEGVSVHLSTGPTNPHVVLLWEGGPRVLFVGDLLMRDGAGEPFAPVPETHHEDYAATRAAVERLLALEPDWICPAHGEPTGNGRLRLESALSAWSPSR